MTYGIVVDLETTGLEAESEQIIEIALLKFSMCDKPEIISLYSELEDPGKPLAPEIIKLTGLNDKLLKGETIDWKKVRKDLEGAELVIAHNMEFDRSFLEQRSELQGTKLNWACSLKHIDWYKRGFKSRALNYLACDHGFINPFPHRALFDCATTFRLLAPHLDELKQRSQEEEYEVLALNSPFKTKDLLKGKGYRWNPEKRVWTKRVFATDLEEESLFLKDQIYNGQDLSQKIKVN